MTELSWGAVGERIYESGFSKGVLYSPSYPVESEFSGSPIITAKGFVWNGLVSVNELEEDSVHTALYFDGIKKLDHIIPGTAAFELKSITYPDEFLEFSGYGEYGAGLFLAEQIPKQFHLSYQTQTGNDVVGTDFGYKIHLLYNLTAIPEASSFQSDDSNVHPITFGWNLSSVPEFPSVGSIYDYPFRPTAHYIIDSTKIHPDALSFIKDILYGTEDSEARMIDISELLSSVGVFISYYEPSEDDVWTAFGPDYLVYMLDADSFTIESDGITMLDSDSYQASSFM